jgi:hypothetical protein
MCKQAWVIEVPAVVEWAQIFKEKKKVVRKVTLALLNPTTKGQLVTDWQMIERLWADEDYFAVGLYLCTMVNIVFGNVDVPPFMSDDLVL